MPTNLLHGSFILHREAMCVREKERQHNRLGEIEKERREGGRGGGEEREREVTYKPLLSLFFHP